jgi:Mn2+/Fe2+ NRAMP family transporter
MTASQGPSEPAASEGPSAGRPTGSETPRVDVKRTTAVAGAMFLMAMSAAGPGFITQTATFTNTYGASFAAAIVASIVIDVAIQLNVWRVIGISGLRAQDLANTVIPRAGYVLTVLIVAGGLVFSIGNIAGAGLGLHNLLGLDPRIGATLSAVLAIVIFSYKGLEGTVDKAVIALGTVKIGLIAFVAVKTTPPVGEAIVRTFVPRGLDFLPVLTLIGGTVGGYITYAGIHRMVESGIVGPGNLTAVTRGAVNGILVTGALRILLFLGVLGVVAGGVALSRTDPAGSAFRSAAGEVGLRLFGLTFWTAGMTSTIGASFTSASFMRTLVKPVDRNFNASIATFITIATLIYLLVGTTPSSLLVFAGAFNGLILPFGLAIVLWVAWRRSDLLAGYRYPKPLLVFGILAWAFTAYAGYESLSTLPTIFT